MTSRKQEIENILTNFRSIAHQITKCGRMLSPQFPITPAQWHTLHLVKHNPNTNLKDLADLLRISPSAMTQLVDGLVENGMLIRKIDSQDRRVLKINITNKIKKHFRTLHELNRKKMSVLFDALTDKELESFRKLTQKMVSPKDKN